MPTPDLLGVLSAAGRPLTVAELVEAGAGTFAIGVFRGLLALEREGKVRPLGRGSAERWALTPKSGEAQP